MMRRNTSLDLSSNNPWDALFSSTTRPRNPSSNIIPSTKDIRTHPFVDADESPSPSILAGGYTILIQHSITCQSQRDYAFSSAVKGGTGHHSVTRSIGALSISRPSQHSSRAGGAQPAPCGEWFGVSGSFLVRKAFEELCCRCDGGVVLVNLLGTGGVVDLESLNRYTDVRCLESGDDDNYHDHVDKESEQDEINRRNQAVQLFRRFGAIVDLASNPFGWAEEEVDDSSDGFITKSTMNSLQSIADAIRVAAARVENYRKSYQSASSSQKQFGQRPIPVVFDSLTPLMSLHGVHNVILLLQSLKQVMASEPSMLSPVVAPILYESAIPSDHRMLEDAADALLSLHLNDIRLQNNEITSGVLDIARRGGSGNSLGGKLLRDCIPVQIMKASEYSLGNRQAYDARDAFYWILNCSNNSAKKQEVSNENCDNPTKNGVEEVKQVHKSGQLTSRPRIYIEDDDPEFDDLDEEDPDDDLDL